MIVRERKGRIIHGHIVQTKRVKTLELNKGIIRKSEMLFVQNWKLIRKIINKNKMF
jgi:hypothetical protein